MDKFNVDFTALIMPNTVNFRIRYKNKFYNGKLCCWSGNYVLETSEEVTEENFRDIEYKNITETKLGVSMINAADYALRQTTKYKEWIKHLSD